MLLPLLPGEADVHVAVAWASGHLDGIPSSPSSTCITSSVSCVVYHCIMKRTSNAIPGRKDKDGQKANGWRKEGKANDGRKLQEGKVEGLTV